MNKNVSAIVKIKKTVGKKKINEYDNLIQQYKKDLVLKKRQTDKLNKKIQRNEKFFKLRKTKVKSKKQKRFQR